MSSSRQRWTLAGLFLGVGLVGWLGAMGTTRIASGYLALPKGARVSSVSASEPTADGPGDSTEPGGRTPRAPRRESKNRYVDAITKRSLFDSSKIGQVADTATVTGDERRSDLKVVLMATIVAVPAEYSSALITEDRDAGAQGFGIGDKILGEAEILEIQPRKVIVRRSDGTVEYIEMGGELDDARSGRPGRLGAKEESTEETGITGGNGKYVVEQEVLDKILENPEQLYSQVRVVPHKDSNGEIDGYRMSGIRRNSLFYQLGVKNGDIVHAVNGKPLTSTGSAMDAYNSLQSAKNFSFEITRRNQKQTFEYEVR